MKLTLLAYGDLHGKERLVALSVTPGTSMHDELETCVLAALKRYKQRRKWTQRLKDFLNRSVTHLGGSATDAVRVLKLL